VVGNWFGGPTEPNGSLDDISGYGRVTSNGHNVFSSDVPGNVPGDIEGFDPARVFAALDPSTGGGALALNGGLTPTAALLDAAANRALGGAEPVTAGAVDQRGAARPLPGDGGPDIGAFELDERAVSTAPTIFNDRLTGSAAADALAGRLGNDHLRGLAGADTLRGDEGGDTLVGGPGGDLLDGSSGLDTASYRDAAGAVDADLAAGRAGGALGADRLLAIENLAGGGFADRLAGDELANALGGGRGDDRLLGRGGADELEGNAGRDLLHGGGGRDALAGGAGTDLFDYDAPAESPWRADRTLGDRIADFAHLTDEIDLSTIDARSATPAVNEAFAFLTVEGAAFTGAGQVRWYRDGGATFVEANTGGSLQAELLIRLDGLTILSATDFVL
jgi:Ca2+-binding RTX toxin-like protein